MIVTFNKYCAKITSPEESDYTIEYTASIEGNKIASLFYSNAGSKIKLDKREIFIQPVSERTGTINYEIVEDGFVIGSITKTNKIFSGSNVKIISEESYKFKKPQKTLMDFFSRSKNSKIELSNSSDLIKYSLGNEYNESNEKELQQSKSIEGTLQLNKNCFLPAMAGFLLIELMLSEWKVQSKVPS